MSRSVYIYGLNYKKIQTEFNKEIRKSANVELLCKYINSGINNIKKTNDINDIKDSIIEKIKNFPQKLTSQELWSIIWSFNDSWEMLSKEINGRDKRIELMGQLGIQELPLKFLHTSDKAGIFINILLDYFPTNEIYKEDSFYKLKMQQFNLFIDWIIIMTKVYRESFKNEKLETLNFNILNEKEITLLAKKAFQHIKIIENGMINNSEFESSAFFEYDDVIYAKTNKILTPFDEFIIFDC